MSKATRAWLFSFAGWLALVFIVISWCRSVLAPAVKGSDASVLSGLPVHDLRRHGVSRLAVDRDGLDARFRLRPGEVDMQEPVVEPGASHLDPFRQHERPLELPRGDPPVEEHAVLRAVGLAAG